MAKENISKYAVNSMCYFILKLAQWGERFEYKEELTEWIAKIEEAMEEGDGASEEDKSTIAFMREAIEEELESGSYLGHDAYNFLENLSAWMELDGGSIEEDEKTSPFFAMVASAVEKVQDKQAQQEA